MIQELLSLLYTIGYIGLIGCIVLLAFVCMLNFMVPYALIRQVRKGDRRTFSLWIGMECIPLLLAIVLSWLLSCSGPLSPGLIAIFGFGLVIASYMHAGIVFCVVGLILWIRRRWVRRA